MGPFDHLIPSAALSDLERLAVALGKLTVESLECLRYSSEKSPQMAPGLLAWLEHATAWELDRRRGHFYELREPLAAIPSEEVALSLWALGVIAALFVIDSARRPPDAQLIDEFLYAARAAITTQPVAPASALH